MASKWSKFADSVRPLTPESLCDHGPLNQVKLPSDTFDPAEQWEHTYRIWMAAGNVWYRSDRGVLRIKHRRLAQGQTQLTIEQKVVQSYQAGLHTTTVLLKCDADALATPRAWQLRSIIQDLVDGSEIPHAGFTETGEVRDGKIVVQAMGSKWATPAPSAYTCNWSLFDAIQRRNAAEPKPNEFVFYDELDKTKPGHRLSFHERCTIPFGDQAVTVNCFQQVGRGMLPMHYYVDEHGRLLLCLSGMRAFILDPDADNATGAVIDFIRKRGPQR